MMEIVIQHSELKIEDLNELFIRIYNHNNKYYLLKLFCDEICYNGNNNNYALNKIGKKNNEINNKNSGDVNKYLNSKIELSFNTLQLMPDFVLLFNYLFIEGFIHSQENVLSNNNKEYDINDSDFEKMMNNDTFFELIKVMSEALLENSIDAQKWSAGLFAARRSTVLFWEGIIRPRTSSSPRRAQRPRPCP